MSSNSGEDAIAAMGIFLPIFLLLAAFMAVLFTPVCIVVLICGDVSLWRGVTITRTEARDFFIYSISGAVLVPMFAVFCALLFHFRIIDEAWPYIFLTGYTLGFLVAAFIEIERDKAAAALPPPAPVQQILPPHEPFRFADWKDDSK